MEILKTYQLFINSKMRDAGTSSDFILNLKKPIMISRPSNYFNIRVLNTTIPHIYNQINSTNNTIKYSINAVIYTITLNIGNYNILQLLSNIADGFKKNALLVLDKFNFTYDNISGKATLEIETANNYNINILFSQNLGLATMLGFDNDILLNNNTKGISHHHVNINPVHSYIIRASTFSQPDDAEWLLEKATFSDILAIIPITTQPGSYIFSNIGGPFIKINNQTIDKINIYLSNNQSYEMDLGGLDWNLTLQIDEVSTGKGVLLNELEKQDILPQEQKQQLEAEKDNILNRLKSIKSDLEKNI